MKKDYHLGLDIGTSSVGFAAIDDNFKLVRAKGKQVIGVRLFKEGKSAAERRGFRTMRRRLKRRKWRLMFLDEFFAPHLQEVDENFLRRLKASNLVNQDGEKPAALRGKLLFPDYQCPKGENGYPTMLALQKVARKHAKSNNELTQVPAFNIYALRLALMTEKRKFDLREVYLAIHHIIKYRGNFLNHTPVDKFEAAQVELTPTLTRLNETFQQLTPEDSFAFDVAQATTIGQLLLDTTITKLDRQKKIAKLLPMNTKSVNQKIATEIAKLILGYKAKVNVILKIEASEPKRWVVALSQADSEETLAAILSELSTVQKEILSTLVQIYSQVMLNEIVPNGVTISQAMVDKYAQHHQQLCDLKRYMAQQPSKVRQNIKHLYGQYVNHSKNKRLGDEEFIRQLKKCLDNSPLGEKIKQAILAGDYLPLQRTAANGVIPYQMHQRELDRIIANQAKYYPWLAELNPVIKNRAQAPYKLDQLLTFRVPYYVGPMVTAAEQQPGQNNFAWAVRRPKATGRLTPWNFDQQFDREASANQFIKRMTIKDAYLPTEDVLPAASLLYQRFTVLNELNNLRVNDGKLTSDQKHRIYHDLFEHGPHVTVSIKDLTNWWRKNETIISTPRFRGLADNEKFTAQLTTYRDLQKIVGTTILTDESRQADLERIVEWATIFEDRKILRAKLNEIAWLTDEQRIKLACLRYQGWGRLSQKLLSGFRDANGARIIDRLWHTNANFMQIINDSEFAEQIEDFKRRQFEDEEVQDADLAMHLVEAAYTSPQNKKALRQVIRLVQDIERAMGKAPKSISLEFAREDSRKKRQNITRKKRLEQIYQSTAAELVAQTKLSTDLASVQELTDRYYLYFTQAGRDIYDGSPIDIDQLSTAYDIDHIMPQAFLKDDSLDNRVLTKRAINNKKSDQVPVKLFSAQKGLWKRLFEAGLITKRKYDLLLMDPGQINKYQALGFANRQLVETRQVIKLAANALDILYSAEQTEILETRAQQTRQLRQVFKLPKVREVNDYHHAMDAYLTVFGARYLYRRYPKLRPFFVYGQFFKGKLTVLPHSFNFFYPLSDESERLHQPILDAEGQSILVPAAMRQYINKIADYKVMLVSKETYQEKGALFGATIYPATAAKTKKLIPIKQGRDVHLYGGYSKEAAAYMAIIKTIERNPKYKLVNVPVQALHDLTEAKAQGQETIKLKQILKAKAIVKKNFDIVVPRVMFGQLIKDGDDQYTLGSANYQANARQLYLTKQTQKLIENHFAAVWDQSDLQEQNKLLVSIFDEIVTQMNHYFSLYDQRSGRKKVTASRDLFLALPALSKDPKVATKATVIIKLLRGLHANAEQERLPEIKVPYFALFNAPNGISLSKEAELIYRSPSGLFERRVKLSEL